MKNAVLVLLSLALVSSLLMQVLGDDRAPERRAERNDEPATRPVDSPPVTRPEPAATEKVVEAPIVEEATTRAVDEEARSEILTALRDPATGASEQSKLWRKLAELGLTDDAIARLREQIKESPRDANLHAMLGNALVTKMRTESLSPVERREVSKGAMGSFNTALELDPQNWVARFSRAMSNSAAPAFLGRQAVAIKDFETLLEQQKGAAPSPDHAHTYFFLANLQAGSGNTKRAAEVRAEARALFPDDKRFREDSTEE